MKPIYRLLLFLFLTPLLYANGSRAEKMEFFFTPVYVNSKTIHFAQGSSIDLNSRNGFGFGMGYNVNKNLELAILFNSSNSSYKATVVQENGSKKSYIANMYTANTNLAATYNFMDGPLTPYVTGTVGYTYVDSGVSNGNIGSGCYWDPWWGYICGPVADTYSSNEFNYGASVGVRYDINRRLYLKFGIGKSWIDFKNSSSNDFTVYDLTLGTKF